MQLKCIVAETTRVYFPMQSTCHKIYIYPCSIEHKKMHCLSTNHHLQTKRLKNSRHQNLDPTMSRVNEKKKRSLCSIIDLLTMWKCVADRILLPRVASISSAPYTWCRFMKNTTHTKKTALSNCTQQQQCKYSMYYSSNAAVHTTLARIKWVFVKFLSLTTRHDTATTAHSMSSECAPTVAWAIVSSIPAG